MSLELRCLLGVTVLWIAAEAVTRLAGRRWAAAERHGVWTVTILLALLLPVLLRIPAPGVEYLASAPAAVAQRITIQVTANGPVTAIPWEEWLPWAWLAGAFCVAAWWLLGFVRVAGMVASSTEHSTFRGVAVRRCAGLRVPAVALGPVILLPPAVESWRQDQLRMVLLHEWGHIQRWDLVWRLAAALACCLYWFHPLAWRAAAQLRKESEMACDDRVIGVESAGGYAESLLAVAREASGHPAPAAVMAMAKPREIEGRLLSVLDGGRRRAPLGWARVAVMLAGGLLLLTPLGAWQEPGVQMRGTVRDEVGAIPGARVIFSGPVEQRFESGPDGAYVAGGLPDGEYNITVEKPGYARLTLMKRKIESARTARADLFLALGKIQETMNVVENAVAATPAQDSGPKRLRISGNVQAARLVHRVTPTYPLEAKMAGIQGTVRLRAFVGKDGSVTQLTVQMSPSPEMARSAVSAVSQWKYQPTLLNGAPVEIETVVDVNYTLAP